METNAFLLKQAVLSHPEAAMELPIGTAHRWFTEGKLPKALDWLISHPEVVRSLSSLLADASLATHTEHAASVA